jgi:hypothetical protein
MKMKYMTMGEGLFSPQGICTSEKMISLYLVLGLWLGTPTQASFRIYDHYDPLNVQAAYGLTTNCLEALSVHTHQAVQ